MDERARDAQNAGSRDHEGGVPPHAGAHLQDLRQGVDYLYCASCGRHVACMRLEGDTWEVQCSRCVGECGLCSCGTTHQCLGKDGAPVDAHMHVARGARPLQFKPPDKEMGNE